MRWAYVFNVMDGLACPSQSATAFTETPRERSVLAKVWRREW